MKPILAAFLAMLLLGPRMALAGVDDTSWPADIRQQPTTSGAIYLVNLDARIQSLESAPLSKLPTGMQALAGALYHRFRIRGQLPDAETALRLLDAAIVLAPEDAAAHQLRGTVLSGFHRFDEARADFEQARSHGHRRENQSESLREMALALGHYESLAGEFEKSAKPTDEFYEQVFRANLRVLVGDPEGANAGFAAAQPLYDDTSPYPLAWLHVQQGIALLRNQQPAQAEPFFRAAHERLPGYTLATEHLAEVLGQLGRHDEARELYRQVIADTGNPEYLGALASLEQADGNALQAADYRRKAEAGWTQWLQRHPSAFAQHGIDFYLGIGQPEHALALARQNIALRRDVGSLVALSEAAAAAGDSKQACSARQEAIATGLNPPELAGLSALDCGS